MASSTYKIAVRTVHPPGDLLHIELGREALVADLHEALRLLHPLQPEKERQRLLFAGRLLRDPREPLASVFQAFPNIPVYTVHLMLAPPSTTSPPPHPPAQEIPRAAEGVAPGDRHGDGRPPGVHVHVHINLSLLLKLALLILVLSQGGGTNRLLFLCLASAFFYMYQMGWLSWLRGLVVPPGQHAPAREARVGLVYEIQDIIVPFFCSLFPSWQPPAPAPAPAPAAGQPPEPEPQPQQF